MTAERRLAALEASLSPTELVLRWLAEAHAYDDFKTYMEALFDRDPSDLPMDRLAREAQTSARTRSRGQPIDKAPIGLVQVRDLLFARVTELHAFETARATVERKHLDGATALFPAAVRDWAEQRTWSETLAVTAFRIAELDGFDALPPDDEVAFDARVAQLV